MSNAWSLNIRVRNQSGKPIDSAAVYIKSGPAPLPDIAALTGADGQVSISVPCEGKYTLSVNAEGYALLTCPIKAVSDDSISEVSLNQ